MTRVLYKYEINPVIPCEGCEQSPLERDNTHVNNFGDIFHSYTLATFMRFHLISKEIIFCSVPFCLTWNFEKINSKRMQKLEN